MLEEEQRKNRELRGLMRGVLNSEDQTIEAQAAVMVPTTKEEIVGSQFTSTTGELRLLIKETAAENCSNAPPLPPTPGKWGQPQTPPAQAALSAPWSLPQQQQTSLSGHRQCPQKSLEEMATTNQQQLSVIQGAQEEIINDTSSAQIKLSKRKKRQNRKKRSN